MSICSEGTFEAYQRMISAESESFESALTLNADKEPLGALERQLLWALSALVAIVIVGGMVCLWETKWSGPPSSKYKLRRRGRTERVVEDESAPLIAH